VRNSSIPLHFGIGARQMDRMAKDEVDFLWNGDIQNILKYSGVISHIISKSRSKVSKAFSVSIIRQLCNW
jgi:hypothetical protein